MPRSQAFQVPSPSWHSPSLAGGGAITLGLLLYVLFALIRRKKAQKYWSARKAEFIARNPTYGYATSKKGFIDNWRSHEFPALLGGGKEGQGMVYVDHAGAALPMRSQLTKGLEQGTVEVLCNPHSSGPGAGRTKALLDDARHRVLNHFSKRPRAFNLMFTSNCSDSLNVLSSSFAFETGSHLIFARNSHTSVLGCREKVKEAGGQWLCLGLDEMEKPGQHWPVPTSPSLVIVPVECNFSGRIADVKRIISILRDISDLYFVAVDIAKYSAFHEIDLWDMGADFAVGSFYKIFGAPTGLGFLLMKRTAAAGVVMPRYFGGGGVSAVLPDEDFVVLRKNAEEVFERGTVNFRGILSLKWGFESLDDLGGVKAMRDHVECLSREFRRSMKLAGGGEVQFHCQESSCSIISFSLKSRGEWIGYNEVLNLAELNEPPIQMRGGCFCNQGACLEALGCDGEKVKGWLKAGHVCGDSLDIIEGERTGAIRVSFGRESTFEDVESVVQFFQLHFFLRGEAAARDEVGTSEVRSPQSVTLKSIYVYPIKSCAAMPVEAQWPLDDGGKLRFDREFCLVDASGVAMRLNRYPKMAKINSAIDLEREELTVSAEGFEDLKIDLKGVEGDAEVISVCSNTCKAHYMESEECAEWFERVLEVKCFLAREVKGEGTFANEAPLLLLSSGSLKRLNEIAKKRGRKEVSELSFRPNLVVDGGGLDSLSNIEDSWTKLTIGTVEFEVKGPCSRCNMVEVDPVRGQHGKGGVLRTLGEYRRDRGQIYFGQFITSGNAKGQNMAIGDNVHAS